MTKAVLATFSDAKAIKGRSVFQIILELPIEQADDALKALGGWPQPSESRWVGIALAKQEREKIEAPAEHKDRKPFHTLPLSQQIALRCNDPVFQKFLGVGNADMAAEEVRRRCDVKSRADIAGHPLAHALWDNIDINFGAYLVDQQYADSMR